MDELKEVYIFWWFLPQNYIGICKFAKSIMKIKIIVVGELSKIIWIFFEQIINFRSTIWVKI